MELAVLWRRGPGLVPELSLLREVREGGLLPRHVAAPRPARSVQAQGGALPPHLRGRAPRRSPVRRLGDPGQPIAWRTHVSGKDHAVPQIEDLSIGILIPAALPDERLPDGFLPTEAGLGARV